MYNIYIHHLHFKQTLKAQKVNKIHQIKNKNISLEFKAEETLLSFVSTINIHIYKQVSSHIFSVLVFDQTIKIIASSSTIKHGRRGTG